MDFEFAEVPAESDVGGGREMLSLDTLRGENSYGWEPADELTPDRLFERRWALTLMARAVEVHGQIFTHKD